MLSEMESRTVVTPAAGKTSTQKKFEKRSVIASRAQNEVSTDRYGCLPVIVEILRRVGIKAQVNDDAQHVIELPNAEEVLMSLRRKVVKMNVEHGEQISEGCITVDGSFAMKFAVPKFDKAFQVDKKLVHDRNAKLKTFIEFERMRVKRVEKEQRAIVDILGHFGIVAEMVGHRISLPNAHVILQGLKAREEKVDAAVQCDECEELKPLMVTTSVQCGNGHVKLTRALNEKNGMFLFYYDNRKFSKQVTYRYAKNLGYTHIVDGNDIFELDQWIIDDLMSSVQFEAQCNIRSQVEPLNESLVLLAAFRRMSSADLQRVIDRVRMVPLTEIGDEIVQMARSKSVSSNDVEKICHVLLMEFSKFEEQMFVVRIRKLALRLLAYLESGTSSSRQLDRIVKAMVSVNEAEGLLRDGDMFEAQVGLSVCHRLRLLLAHRSSFWLYVNSSDRPCRVLDSVISDMKDYSCARYIGYNVAHLIRQSRYLRIREEQENVQRIQEETMAHFVGECADGTELVRCDFEAQLGFDFNVNHRIDARITEMIEGFVAPLKGFFENENIVSIRNKIVRFVFFVFECVSDSPWTSKMRALGSFLMDYELATPNVDLSYMKECAQVLAQVLKGSSAESNEDLEAQLGFEDISKMVSQFTPDVEISSFGEKVSDCMKTVKICMPSAGLDNAKKILYLVLGVFTSILSIRGFSASDSLKKSSIQKVAEVSKALKSAESIWKFVDTVFGEALSCILEKFGISTPDQHKKYLTEEVYQWLKEIEDLPVDVDIAVTKDYTLAMHIVYLSKQGDIHLANLQKMRAPGGTMTMFMNRYSYLKTFAKRIAPHFYHDTLRESPFVLHLYGNSGVGKSSVKDALITDMMREMKFPFNPVRDKFVRNPRQDHWDGYTNQPVVIFDDFMQCRDPQARSIELTELIAIKGTTAYPLKMASLEDKGNTRFNSKMVVLTSNLDFPANGGVIRESLECPQAIARRIDVSARLVIRKDMIESGTHKLDKSKLTNPEDVLDVSIMGFYVAGSKVMNYTAFVRYCVRKWMTEYERDQRLNKITMEWKGSDLKPAYMDADDFDLGADEMDDQQNDRRVCPDCEERKQRRCRREPQCTVDDLPAEKVVDPLMREMMQNWEAQSKVVSSPEEAIERKWFEFLLQERLMIDVRDVDRLVRTVLRMCRTRSGFRFYRDELIANFAGETRDDRRAEYVLMIRFCNFVLKECMEAQYGFSFGASGAIDDSATEVDVITEEELMLVNYCAKTLKDEKPQSDWRQIMKDKFYELKEQTVSYAQRFKESGKAFYEKWVCSVESFCTGMYEKYPWLRVAMIVMQCIGVLGGLFMLYSVATGSSAPKIESESQVSGDERTMRYSRKYVTPRFRQMVSEAAVSGDQRTMQHARRFRAKIESESAVSGDDRTMVHGRRFVSVDKMNPENFVSGDQKTVVHQRRFTDVSVSGEAAVSGDDRTLKFSRKFQDVSDMKPEASIERKNFDGVVCDMSKDFEAQQTTDPAAHELMEHKIMYNLCRVSCVLPSGQVASTNGLFLCDHVLLMPRHLKMMIPENGDFKFETILTACNVNLKQCEVIDDEHFDVTFVRVPNWCGGFKSIVDHFHDLEELEKVNIDTGVLCLLLGKEKLLPWQKQADNIAHRGYTEYPSRDDMGRIVTQNVVVSGYQYRSQTNRGDCGAPLIALHRGLKKKILGVHIAGHANTGMSCLLTQEHVRKMLGMFKDVIFQCVPPMSTAPFEAHSVVRPDDNVEICGRIDKAFQFRNVGETNIRESPLHGIFEVRTCPAMLKPEGDINPLRIGLEPQFVEQIRFPQYAVDMAVHDLKTCILTMQNKAYVGKGLLSDKVMLNGLVGDQWIRPLNLKTSPGFPYVHMKRTGAGKYGFIEGEVGDFRLDEFTQSLVLQRENMARKGEIPLTLFCDATKDERRPIAKVREGKTRVFNTAPFDLTCLVRKYFANFNAHLMENHTLGECSVGVNAHSDDWTVMYNDLNDSQANWIAGDFSKYDKTLSFQLIMGALDVINAWYDDGEENARIRKTLFYTMFNATHLTGDIVYRVRQGNPSGIPLTVIINSLVNSLISRVVFVLIGEKHGKANDMTHFHRFVKVKNYGDDNIGKVSSQCPWYNMITIRDCLKGYNVKYTPPTKGDVVCEYLDEKDVSYLKRTFVKRGARVWAPLDRVSIEESIMWYRAGSLSPEDAVRATFLNAMVEMVHYGRKAFNEFQEYVSLEAARRGFHVPCTSYEVMEQQMTDGYMVLADAFQSEDVVEVTVYDEDLYAQNRDFRGKGVEMDSDVQFEAQFGIEDCKRSLTKVGNAALKVAAVSVAVVAVIVVGTVKVLVTVADSGDSDVERYEYYIDGESDSHDTHLYDLH